MKSAAAAAALVALAACGSSSSGPTAFFDLAAATSASSANAASGSATTNTFWDFPFPSDLRLASGSPDLTGFPNPRNVPLLGGLTSIIPARPAFPVMSAAYFHFTAPLPAFSLDDGAVTDGTVLLVDIDPASPDVGSTAPVVRATLPPDGYVPLNLLAVAPRPGIVLHPNTQYAYVILAAGLPGFSAPAAFADLASGGGDAATRAAFANLWPALDQLGIAHGDVVVATTFTTGDEVARTRARSEAIRAAYHPTIDGLALVGGDTYSGFCRLDGTISMPQFQTGTQPFDSGGIFVVDGNDVPQHQSDMTIPVVITLPKQTMPAGGWPLYQFFHGSGGLSTGLVDLGPSLDSSDMPIAGEGPGYVVALHGIAAASSALPLNPERLIGANDYEYLNINNLAAFPFTFQQGVFEQRLLTDALLATTIPDSALAGCSSISSGGAGHSFAPDKLVAGGQSQGGMYTNLVGAVEPRFGAFVPTGAGGFWNLMILETTSVPGARELLATAIGIDDTTISFVHPTLNLMALAWEIAEPVIYMKRVAEDPLPGLPVRHVYEPVGKSDTYFPIDVYDAAALSYGNEQAGDPQWPSMQDALALDHLDGLLAYPVKADRAGKTRVVVQFQGDGIIDPHYIYRQLDAVKHQYGCFLESYLRDGVPTVPAPGGLTDPCP